MTCEKSATFCSGNGDEEVERILYIYNELFGRLYTDEHGMTKLLELDDFLFIAPYNAQVRALKTALMRGAKVGEPDSVREACAFSSSWHVALRKRSVREVAEARFPNPRRSQKSPRHLTSLGSWSASISRHSTCAWLAESR